MIGKSICLDGLVLHIVLADRQDQIDSLGVG